MSSTGPLNINDGFPADREMPRWFAIRTRSRHEKTANAELLLRGVDTFLPMTKELHRWSDRNKKVDSPLFPGYAFVRIVSSAVTRLSVLRAQGVIGFVGTRNHGIPIPEDQIEDIRSLLARKVTMKEHPYFREGERIRIRGGALDGIEGILSAYKGDKHLVISIDMIQRSVALSLEGYDIEVIETSTDARDTHLPRS